jgi:Bacteriophage probable baseplate hub protein
MATPTDLDQLVPQCRLRVGGADLSTAARLDLVEVAVHQDVTAPAMFALRLINWDMEKLAVTWADDPLFAAGAEVEILMGYQGKLDTVLTGEVTGLEPEFEAGEVPMLTVRGYDRRHRLMRGRKTRSFLQSKDSDVASTIAQEAGLTAKAEDTGVVHDYVLQHGQTDLEFLEERARRIGFEVALEGKDLLFRAHQNTGQEALTLEWNKDLLEFFPRQTTLGQAGEVAVRGWSVKDKKALIGNAAAGDEGTKMGGSTTGPAAAESAFGSAVAVCVDDPVLSQAEADQLATGQLKEMALSHVRGEGAVLGRADLKAGTVIKVQGIGKRFSGLYYVSAACHTYSPRRGYRTAFTFRRNAT